MVCWSLAYHLSTVRLQSMPPMGLWRIPYLGSLGFTYTIRHNHAETQIRGRNPNRISSRPVLVTSPHFRYAACMFAPAWSTLFGEVDPSYFLGTYVEPRALGTHWNTCKSQPSAWLRCVVTGLRARQQARSKQWQHA